jgi:sterol carrier protein 2
MLQCCPTSDGAGCIILASEEFVLKNNLQDQAVEILDIQLGTDKYNLRDSAMNLIGYDMTRQAADKLYANTGIKPE